MKKFLLLIIVTLVILLMYFTNPTIKDYESFVKEQISNEISENDTTGGLNDLLGNIFSMGGAVLATQKTNRTNYHLFSTYTLEMDDEEYTYVGLFTKFIPLQSSNPLENMN